MTGLLGGGHAIVLDARERHRAQPRLLLRRAGARSAARARRSSCTSRCRSAPRSCTTPSAPHRAPCPGVPAGLGELWRAHGRLPWRRLVEPALRLARDGVAMPEAHVACLHMLEPVMTMREGARMYAPGGTLLEPGERLRQPGLVAALESLAEEGAAGRLHGDDRRSAARALRRTRRPPDARRPRGLRAALERARRDGVARAAVPQPRRTDRRRSRTRAAPPAARALTSRAGARSRRRARRHRAARRRTRRTSSPSTQTATPAC